MWPVYLVLTLFNWTRAQSDTATRNYNLIDPFIGSVNGGNVFAGTSLPFGMAKAVADVSGQNTAGWAYDFTNVTRISALHVSGTGGQPSQGNFPLSVQTTCTGESIVDCRFGSKYERAVDYRAGTARATPGYFALGLQDGVDVEMTCSPLDELCSYSSNPRETFESSIWEYRFCVPHDEATLISTLGGPGRFVQRLDYLHKSGLLDIGNEPSELTVYQYQYARRPRRSAYRIHTYIPSSFNASVSGLPGNDDSGASGLLLAFALSALFPVAGQDVYLITPTFFGSVSCTSPVTNRITTICNRIFDPTYEKIYIQNATLDGVPYTKNWIGHEFFSQGGTLELTLGSQEDSSAWGTKVEDLPPSVSAGHGGYHM